MPALRVRGDWLQDTAEYIEDPMCVTAPVVVRHVPARSRHSGDAGSGSRATVAPVLV
jgi:hypothetical protein